MAVIILKRLGSCGCLSLCDVIIGILNDLVNNDSNSRRNVFLDL